MKRIVPIVVLLAVIAGGVCWARNRQAHRTTDVLRLYGNVDIREAQLGFRVPGRLAAVLVDEGDAVGSETVVARLDDAPYRREAEESAARLESARARLRLLEAGNRPQELEQARAALRERQVLLGNAERIFRRQQELWEGRAVSQQERDDAEARFQEAEARANSAKAQLGLLEAGFREEEIAQAKAEVTRAEAAVASANLRVSDTALKAPTAGIVLTRAVEPGTYVQAGAPVVTLSLTNPVWVRAYVDEPNLGRVRPGASVRVISDSRPTQPYKGQVGFISPRAEFTPKSVETPELRTSLVYRLRIVVDDSDGSLRQGMPVTVDFATP